MRASLLALALLACSASSFADSPAAPGTPHALVTPAPSLPGPTGLVRIVRRQDRDSSSSGDASSSSGDDNSSSGSSSSESDSSSSASASSSSDSSSSSSDSSSSSSSSSDSSSSTDSSSSSSDSSTSTNTSTDSASSTSSSASATPTKAGVAGAFQPSNKYFPAAVVVTIVIAIAVIVIVIAVARFFMKRQEGSCHRDSFYPPEFFDKTKHNVSRPAEAHTLLRTPSPPPEPLPAPAAAFGSYETVASQGSPHRRRDSSPSFIRDRHPAAPRNSLMAVDDFAAPLFSPPTSPRLSAASPPSLFAHSHSLSSHSHSHSPRPNLRIAIPGGALPPGAGRMTRSPSAEDGEEGIRMGRVGWAQ